MSTMTAKKPEPQTAKPQPTYAVWKYLVTEPDANGLVTIQTPPGSILCATVQENRIYVYIEFDFSKATQKVARTLRCVNTGTVYSKQGNDKFIGTKIVTGFNGAPIVWHLYEVA